MTEAEYNDSCRMFVNNNRSGWPSGWPQLPAPKQEGEYTGQYAARCATWMDEAGGYRDWYAAYPTRVDPPQDPQDSGGTGGRVPPPPPPKRN
jgi:hypothetical protein